MEKKVKVFLKLVPLVFFPVLLLCVGLLICSKPRGFSVHKISSSLPYDEQWESDGIDLEIEKAFVRDVFSQPFYYWGSDLYWYGFISKDQKYLLKFFKMHRLLPKTGWVSVPLALFEGYRFNHVDKKKEVLKEIFSSVKAAYDLFREQTTLLYVHLNKTRRLKKKVELIDQFGRHFFVDLDTKEFVLDQKAEPLYTYLIGLCEANQEQELRAALRSVFSVIVARCKKGYGERDHQMGAHYGFLDGRFVLFDADRLVPEEWLKHPHNYEREVASLSGEISAWMKQYYPKMTPVVEEELQAFIAESALPN